MKKIYGIWDERAQEWNGVFLANNDQHAIAGIESSMIKKLPMSKEIEHLTLVRFEINIENPTNTEEVNNFTDIWQNASLYVNEQLLKANKDQQPPVEKQQPKKKGLFSK